MLAGTAHHLIAGRGKRPPESPQLAQQRLGIRQPFRHLEPPGLHSRHQRAQQLAFRHKPHPGGIPPHLPAAGDGHSHRRKPGTAHLVEHSPADASGLHYQRHTARQGTHQGAAVADDGGIGFTQRTALKVPQVDILGNQIGDRLDITDRLMTPVQPDRDLNRVNPVGKVPTLVLADGTSLYDSRVICEYLDSLHDGEKLFPGPGPARWQALRRQALADGILEAGILGWYETFLRPDALRWPDWIEGQRAKIHRATEDLEKEAAGFADLVDIGTVSIACALDYLDFRYADLIWRRKHPDLANWYTKFAERPSMQRTVPVEIW